MRAFGGGRGLWGYGGFGPRYWWTDDPAYYADYAEMTPDEEKAFLKEQVGVIEEEMKYLRERLAELEQGKVEKKK